MKDLRELDPYHRFAVTKLAEAYHTSQADIVAQMIREWIGKNYIVVKDARASLADFARKNPPARK